MAAMVIMLMVSIMNPGTTEGFKAYDCANTSNRVDVYSLLQPAECPTATPVHAVERTIFGEIVQIKGERTVPIFRCRVIESIVSQYCGFLSAGGVTRYLKWREPRAVEAQDCRDAERTGKLQVHDREFSVTPGTTTSHSMFLAGDLTDSGDCTTGVIETASGQKLGGQAAQAMFEIIVSKEYAKVNDFKGIITVAAGISAKVTDLSLVDTMEGTYVWEHVKEACPRTLIQLFRGMIRIFSNSTANLEGSTAMVEVKDQAAGLELGHMFVLCGSSALRTHIDNIAVFAHQDQRMEVASGAREEEATDTTRLESAISFQLIKKSMKLEDKIRQVKHEICQNRRETAFLRLESIAGADNPYSLLQTFGRGHTIATSGAVAYVTQCNPVEVLPRVSGNCTEEIPVTWGNASVFVDPISFVIKTAASPTRCNDIAPPRWNIAGRWYCAYPAIRECATPMDLPVEAVKIDEEDPLDLGLGRSIYSKEQIAEFQQFQDSQGTRKAYLAETAELAYSGRAADGTWGLGLGDRAREAIIDAVGISFIPLYRIMGPLSMTVILILFIWSLLRLLVTIATRAYAIFRAKGTGMWLLGACWSLPFQLLMSPFRWASDAAEDIADRVGTEMECQAAHKNDRKAYPVSELSRMERGSLNFPPYVPNFKAATAPTVMHNENFIKCDVCGENFKNVTEFREHLDGDC